MRIPAETIALHARAMKYAGNQAYREMFWHELVQVDGELALRTLPPELFAKLTTYMRERGAPEKQASTPRGIVQLILAQVNSDWMPMGSWRDDALLCMVASVALMRIAQEAWAYNDHERERIASETFRRKMALVI
jgi:hypothetical protein